jgi:hypothetical protein
MLDTEDEVRLQSRSLEPITESVNVTDVAEQSQASEHPDTWKDVKGSDLWTPILTDKEPC